MTASYGLTSGEVEVTPRDTSWQLLRALRHDPPHLAQNDPDRRAMFSAAIEQSEQLFRAAEAAGTDTRPLLLFYGLSQSGRALRATADPNTRWGRAGGHGLKMIGESVGARLSSASVADYDKGLFRDVGRTLGCATLGTGQSVGTLARLGRLASRFPLPGSEPDYLPLSLRLRDREPFDGLKSLHAELLVPAATWARELPVVGTRTTLDYDGYKEHVRSQLAHYPTLREAQLVIDSPRHFDLGGAGAQRIVPLEWPDRRFPTPDEEEAVLLAFGDGCGSEVVVYPSVSGSDLAVHPYLLWWAVLYAMSHYVRYEPTRWAEIIDVDHSAEAVAVESLCRQALDLLPMLIYRTLTRPLS